MKISFTLILSLLLTTSIYSQNSKEKEKIIQATDVVKLNELGNIFQSEYKLRQARIDKYLQSNFVSKKIIVDGVEKEIYDVDENGNVSYAETTNRSSSITITANQLYSGGVLGLNLQGQGMEVGVWDSGPAKESHVEFNNSRVSIFDFTDYSNHGTHVIGTILAGGINTNARGIAFQANGKSFDWNNDYAEMSFEAAGGLLVSNHSYWQGSTLNTWVFGAYDSRAQQMDNITFAAPYYLPVVSAGNDRNSNASTILSNQNQLKFGYDLIRGQNNAKNSLTVGAVSSVLSYIDPGSVQMSSFSSWGPTDDGRIKPEVVAKGVAVFSSVATSDTSYDTYQGTSMASPAVAGSCLLLQQHYNNLNSNFMRASTLKGLVMHTAKEAGLFNGPDYEFGWGLVDSAAAANLITAKNTGTAVIDELLLSNNTTYTRTFNVDNPSNVKVSICWTDPAPANFNSGVVDPNSTYLVNDLDLKVTKNQEVFFPWSLDKNFPYNAATRLGTNNVDIFERVDLENVSGTYTITVSHKGNLPASGQRFSLIISGDNLSSLNTNEVQLSAISIYPNPTNQLLNYSFSEEIVLKDIVVYDVSGKKILTKESNLSSNQIDVSGLSSGIYFVTFNTDNATLTKKFVKN
ncbi:S8 family serine peptidase [Flavobacterium sp.]|uniref:S8 family serine peptidase n=1 Tax=Flavobacterium sp. TaxID=239 RepID=UPI0025EC17F8|nr:S8 family serine peptidase [Flavobacterium sp.]